MKTIRKGTANEVKAWLKKNHGATKRDIHVNEEIIGGMVIRTISNYDEKGRIWEFDNGFDAPATRYYTYA